MSHDPQTAAEWQEAANLAHFYLLLHSARCYGLVEGGPDINVERCEQLLRGARDRGTEPEPLKTLVIEVEKE